MADSDGLNVFTMVIDQGHAHTVIEREGGRAAGRKLLLAIFMARL